MSVSLFVREDIRPLAIRSIRPAINDLTSKHNARSTGNHSLSDCFVERVSPDCCSPLRLPSFGPSLLECTAGRLDTDADQEPSHGF